LRNKLDALLGSASIEDLRTLDPAVLKPLVHFKQLRGAVEAIQNAPKYLKHKDMVKFLGKQQKEDIKGLFHRLDRNGDGVIDAEDIESAIATLLSTGCKLDAAEFTVDDLCNTVMAANDDHMLDETAFLRMMAKRTTEEVMNADTLYDTFRSIDKDGNGVIGATELSETVTAITNADDMDADAASEENVKHLVRAFDTEGSGLVDYKEFVNMVVGRCG